MLAIYTWSGRGTGVFSIVAKEKKSNVLLNPLKISKLMTEYVLLNPLEISKLMTEYRGENRVVNSLKSCDTFEMSRAPSAVGLHAETVEAAGFIAPCELG